MKPKILFLVLFIFVNFTFIGNDIIKNGDALDSQTKFKDALKYLLENYNDQKPDINIAWRIARETYEVAELENSKNDKIKLYDNAIKITKPLLDIDFPEKRTKADLIHWYAINYASKMKTMGIFGARESLNVVPELFKLMDKCILTDPTYAGAYFFIARLKEDVPFFLGGDLFEMSKYYQTAFKYANDKEKLFFYLNASSSYLKRNWSADKKEIVSKNKKDSDGTPSNLSDREYAKTILLLSKNMYENTGNPTQREKDIYNQILKSLEKIKK